jgi:hypothetical protein
LIGAGINPLKARIIYLAAQHPPGSEMEPGVIQPHRQSAA